MTSLHNADIDYKLNLGTLFHDGELLPNHVRVNPDILCKHAVVMGASGSGKTGVVLGVCEELVRIGVPTIILDVKGDMLNLAQQNDPDLRDKMHVRLITPGADHGQSVNLFAGLSKPECVSNSVSCILKTIGDNPDPLTSRKHTFLSKILEYMHRNNIPVDLKRLIEYAKEPPFENFGMLTVEEAVPVKVRASLAAKINNLMVAPSFKLWLEGVALDLEECFKIRNDGRTNVTVYSVAHIVDEDSRQFAMALLFDEILAWMRKQPGSKHLRAALVVDECAGILPPHPYNPPTKKPIVTLLKQGRGFGLSVVLATQNVKDVDYKAIGNCETFILGKLFMKRDREAVVDAVAAQCGTPPDVISFQLARLKTRQFMIVRPGQVVTVLSRDVTCQLNGPLLPHEMAAVVG